MNFVGVKALVQFVYPVHQQLFICSKISDLVQTDLDTLKYGCNLYDSWENRNLFNILV